MVWEDNNLYLYSVCDLSKKRWKGRVCKYMHKRTIHSVLPQGRTVLNGWSNPPPANHTLSLLSDKCDSVWPNVLTKQISLQPVFLHVSLFFPIQFIFKGIDIYFRSLYILIYLGNSIWIYDSSNSPCTWTYFTCTLLRLPSKVLNLSIP